MATSPWPSTATAALDAVDEELPKPSAHRYCCARATVQGGNSSTVTAAVRSARPNALRTEIAMLDPKGTKCATAKSRCPVAGIALLRCNSQCPILPPRSFTVIFRQLMCETSHSAQSRLQRRRCCAQGCRPSLVYCGRPRGRPSWQIRRAITTGQPCFIRQGCGIPIVLGTTVLQRGLSPNPHSPSSPKKMYNAEQRTEPRMRTQYRKRMLEADRPGADGSRYVLEIGASNRPLQHPLTRELL